MSKHDFTSQFYSFNSSESGYHTICYQGIFCSHAFFANYTNGYLKATTNQHVWCSGRNNLKPVNVLHNPFIGTETADINIAPFSSSIAYFNPIKVVSASISKVINWYHGIAADPPLETQKENINTHTFNISKISLAQETDILSHQKKYELWKKQFPHNALVLYGFSKGAAATFCAFTKYKYPEVKLVVLEGCFYSIDDLIKRTPFSTVAPLVHAGISFFTRYKRSGPSPGSCIKDFPPHVPVVFITSKKDIVVPAASTERLAKELAQLGKNNVYLLKLEKSSHPNYIYDDLHDRQHYETFMHAIYKQYRLPFIEELAEQGEHLLAQARVKPEKNYKSSNLFCSMM